MSVCRGCAGTGLDHTLSAREVQVAQQPIMLAQPGFGSERLRERELRVCPASDPDAGRRVRGRFDAPLALVIAELDRLEAEGFELRTGVRPERAWACSWCHGTGEPNLSVATLQQQLQGEKPETRNRR